jgi:hypothetical protein
MRQDMLVHREAVAEAERIDDAVLRREVAGEESSATGRAHAAVAEGAVEGESVPAQLGHAGEVSLFPTRGEMLDGALLIGQEEDDVHPRDTFRGSRRLGDPCPEHWNGEGRGAQEIATPPVQVQVHARLFRRNGSRATSCLYWPCHLEATLPGLIFRMWCDSSADCNDQRSPSGSRDVLFDQRLV